MSQQSTYIIPTTEYTTELSTDTIVDVVHQIHSVDIEVGIARQAVINSFGEVAQTTPEQQLAAHDIAKIGKSIADARRYRLDSEFVVTDDEARKLR